MSRRVIWSPSARSDLREQFNHIIADDPDAAARVSKRIRATGDALGDFATGHPGRVVGTYEKSMRGLPYILAYALTDNDRVVTILRFIHTARDWSEGGWPE